MPPGVHLNLILLLVCVGFDLNGGAEKNDQCEFPFRYPHVTPPKPEHETCITKGYGDKLWCYTIQNAVSGSPWGQCVICGKY